jgi:hypothetical protein
MKIDATYDHDRRHGGPYDRGGADYYYGRGFQPHYYIGDTLKGIRIERAGMSLEELSAYEAGYLDARADGDLKEWG